MHLFRVEPIMDDLANKLVSRLVGELLVKLDDDRLLYPKHLKIREPLVQRLQQRRGRFGMQHRPRMRVKSDRRRHRIDGASTLDHRLHYPLVPQMQTVKNAQRQNRRPLNIRVLSPVKYSHYFSVNFELNASGSSTARRIFSILLTSP